MDTALILRFLIKLLVKRLKNVSQKWKTIDLSNAGIKRKFLLWLDSVIGTDHDDSNYDHHNQDKECKRTHGFWDY